MLFPKSYELELRAQSEEDKDPYLWDIEHVEESQRFPLSILPSHGFINRYIRYASRLTDAPPEFHLLTAFSLLGVVSHQYSFAFGDSFKRFNLWMVMVAGTATFRKSTATKMGTKILNMITDAPQETLLYPNDFSVEKLLIELVEHTHGLFHWDEFGGVLSRFDRQYMAGAKEMFTELFENAFFKRKIKSADDIIINNPHISILTSTTMDWFQDKVLPEDIEGGWLNRFIYCVVKKKIRDQSLPLFTAEPGEQIVLRDLLRRVFKMKRALTLSPGATEMYDVYYRKFSATIGKSQDRIRNLFIRHPLYALKIACLYQINEDPSSTIITDENMRRAVVFMKWLWDSSYDETREHLLLSDTVRLRGRIMDRIRMAGKEGIPRSALLRNTHITARELDVHLDTLMEEDRVIIEEDVGEGKRRYCKKYVAT